MASAAEGMKDGFGGQGGNANMACGGGIEHQAGTGGHDDQMVGLPAIVEDLEVGSGCQAHLGDTVRGGLVSQKANDFDPLSGQGGVKGAEVGFAPEAVTADTIHVVGVVQESEAGRAGLFVLKLFEAGIVEFDDSAAFYAEEVVVVRFGMEVFVIALVAKDKGAGDFMLAEDVQDAFDIGAVHPGIELAGMLVDRFEGLMFFGAHKDVGHGQIGIGEGRTAFMEDFLEAVEDFLVALFGEFGQGRFGTGGGGLRD